MKSLVSTAALAIVVATLVNMFPTDAIKTNLLMGLWKALERRKVAAMKAHPARERTDPTRSRVLKLVSCCWVISSAFMIAVVGWEYSFGVSPCLCPRLIRCKLLSETDLWFWARVDSDAVVSTEKWLAGV